MNRSVETADLLLKAGADPNSALPDGETILMTAARSGSPEVVELLIQRGANVAATEPSFGETALMVAAMANHAGVIQVLLKHGAQVNGRTKELSYPKDRFGLEGVLTICRTEAGRRCVCGSRRLRGRGSRFVRCRRRT